MCSLLFFVLLLGMVQMRSAKFNSFQRMPETSSRS
jgi:hypothetical protein